MATSAKQTRVYSVQSAFVVWFATHTDFDPARAAGRIEHAATGETAAFETVAGMLAFVERVLRRVRASAAIHSSGPSNETLK